MDQPIQPQQTRRRRRMRIAAALLLTASMAGAAWGLQHTFRPSVSASEVVIGQVQRGAISNAISAAGLVIPAHEELVVSPAQTRVLRVRARAGQQVKAGELLLELDDRALRLASDTLHEQIAQQDNRIGALAQELEQKRKQIVAATELLELDLKSARARLARFKALREHGAVSGEDMLTAELNVQRIEIQIRQQQEQLADARRSSDTAIRTAGLDRAILKKQLAQQLHQLDLAQVRAPFDGMLSFVQSEEGSAVQAGQTVARLFGQNDWQVEVSLSDLHARSVQAGQPVRLEQGKQIMAGRVRTVLPEIQNGTMKLLVSLDQPSHPSLRNRLRMDAFIVTGEKPDVLLVPIGPGLSGKGRQPVWRVTNGRGEKIDADFGMSDGRSIEVMGGLRAGERLIVSDMKRYEHLDELRVTP
jgi:HlyD family secretion protein